MEDYLIVNNMQYEAFFFAVDRSLQNQKRFALHFEKSAKSLTSHPKTEKSFYHTQNK